MGLDIAYFSDIEKYEGEIETDSNGKVDHEWLGENGLVRLSSTQRQEERADGVEGIYSFGDSDGFRAGSYRHYSLFRELLARTLLKVRNEELDTEIDRRRKQASRKIWENADKYKDEPFFEQIDFPDHGGIMGPETAEKLAKDYNEHEDTFRDIAKKHYGSDASGFLDSYQNWKKAFNTVAGNGAVKFW